MLKERSESLRKRKVVDQRANHPRLDFRSLKKDSPLVASTLARALARTFAYTPAHYLPLTIAHTPAQTAARDCCRGEIDIFVSS